MEHPVGSRWFEREEERGGGKRQMGEGREGEVN